MQRLRKLPSRPHTLSTAVPRLSRCTLLTPIQHRTFSEYEREPRTRNPLLHPIALFLYTVPLIGVAAWYWYTANPYPNEARQALRKALMSHNYQREGVGKPEDAEAEYIKGDGWVSPVVD